ncbi:LuxR C-terminal-related transcriptional regulator [Streptomyces sp. NPDC002680]|uniref:LuxR C-terminal-related transcriptional regulator n=1 Tax=Streptomyces sp. NPDC002680 TaxID=3364659 RepID=UPI00368707F2
MSETTSFIDRRDEQAQVRALLARTRLVTLTGPGGVGKTRLAARVATRVARAFPDGVRFVHLADLDDPALVPRAAATALDLYGDHSTRGRPETPDALADRLSARRILLVLDNCEHLHRACAELAGALLHGTTGVRVLATSRHRLGLTEEHLLDVRPLPLPDPDGDLSAAHRHPALALFADRAAAALPGFTLTPANRTAVARLCHRLDGLPLAIELAAARMGELGDEDITGLQTRIDDDHTRAGRHGTLRATIDRSHQLCTPEERLVWARASVLPGDFDLETAEAVCGEGTDDVLEAVTGLVGKSVLSRETDPDGGVRYRLLDTLRQYGLDRLRQHPGAEGAARRRHADWTRTRATTYEQSWFGPDQRQLATRLLADRANLRAALDFSLGSSGSPGAEVRTGEEPPPDERRAGLGVDRADVCAGLGGGLGGSGSSSGAEVRACGVAPGDRPASLRVDLPAALDFSPGSPARPDTEIRPGGAAPDDPRAGLRLAGTLWFHWYASGVPGEGRYWLDRALGANPGPSRDRVRALWASGLLGLLTGSPEELARGRRQAEEARALAQRLGDVAEAAHAGYVVGVGLLLGGQPAAAVRHFEDAVARGPVPGGHASLAGLERVQLACALTALGEADRAVALCEHVLRVCGEYGEQWVRSYALRALAHAHTLRKDPRRAEPPVREALRIAHTLHDVLGIAPALDLLALIATAHHHAHDHAAVLLGGADRVRSTASDSVRQDAETGAREGLGRRAYERAYRRGGRFGLAGIVKYALREEDSAEGNRTGGAGPPSDTHGSSDRGTRLTRRETEVAALIAEGLANQQIADRLVIARRTAEGHVERILGKLGLSNRTQIAAWVTTHR